MTAKRTLGRIAAAAGLTIAGLTTAATIGTSTAAAAPLPHVDTKNHTIVVDLPAGEWWQCQATGNTPPFIAESGGWPGYTLGPNKIVFNQFPRGAQVWISCNGSGLPIVYYGPILTV